MCHGGNLKKYVKNTSPHHSVVSPTAFIVWAFPLWLKYILFVFLWTGRSQAKDSCACEEESLTRPNWSRPSAGKFISYRKSVTNHLKHIYQLQALDIRQKSYMVPYFLCVIIYNQSWQDCLLYLTVISLKNVMLSSFLAWLGGEGPHRWEDILHRSQCVRHLILKTHLGLILHDELMNGLWCLIFHRHQDHTMGWSQTTELSHNWTSESILYLTDCSSVTWYWHTIETVLYL